MRMTVDERTLDTLATDGNVLFEDAKCDILEGDGRATGIYRGFRLTLETLGLWPAVSRRMNQLRRRNRRVRPDRW